MPPAARISDMHVCPMVTGIVPHVGGPILPPCMPTVLIGGLPAARMTDLATCVGPPDSILMGSPSVLIGGLMAARMGDPTVHGGVIVMGCPTVMIGIAAGGGSGMAAMQGGFGGGFPPCGGAASAAMGAGSLVNGATAVFRSAVAGGVACLGSPAGRGSESSSGSGQDDSSTKRLSWYKAQVLTPDGQPAIGLGYALKLPDGTEVQGSTDEHGMVKVGGIPPGECHLRLLTVDRRLWHKK